MKKLFFITAICMIAAGCEKYDSGTINQDPVGKRVLSKSETILKNNLDQAARILADVIQDEAVMNELTLLSQETREFYSLSFSDLLDESKGVSGSFSNLREGFLSGCSASGSKGGWSELADFLAKNDCYIYCPYPESFYPKGNGSYTVAAHPIDNDVENTGYRFEGKKMIEVKVNEEYADKYMVILIMPKDEDDGLKGIDIKELSGAKGDPVYEVKIGKVRCADYCGGLFEGELELRITRGYPEYNLLTGAINGKFTTAIPVKYPKDYAKAAINNWTQYCSGGWFSVFIPWDTNWNTSKTQQCILVYEYDSVKESTIGGTVGYKIEDATTTLTASAKTTYSGNFLGLNEWDRDWFLSTNTNPGIYDEVKDGLVVRKTCPEFKLTTPLRVIN